MTLSKNQTVLITGASSGIGFEMAKVFAKNEYNLILVARRTEPMQELAKMFPNQKIQVISKDLSQIEDCKDLVQELHNTQIDILVNNAGFGDHGEFQDTDVNRQLSMINLNISALTYLTHIFGSKMVAAKHGKIINVASIVAFMPGPTMATYFASKAFVLSFSQALAKEWGKYDVQVLALCPGATSSGFQESSNLLKTNFGQNKNIPSSAEVAQYAFDQLMKGKTLAIHGFRNKVITFLPRILPRSIYLSIIENVMK
jgi:short-subunit dehydrogenase